MNGKQVATALLLVLMLAIGWWLRPVPQRGDGGEVARDRRDSFAERVHLRVMDGAGRPAYALRAASMDYYPDEDRLVLAQPRLSLAHIDGSRWELRAEEGRTGLDSDRVLLVGDVKIQRLADDSHNPLEVVTRDVLVDTVLGLATTDAKARISGNGYRVEAVGLKADLKQRRLELESQVRGSFDAAS